jgi:hypothetical protein
MSLVLRLLAGILLVAPAAEVALAAEAMRPGAQSATTTGGTPRSEAAIRVADWIAASGDNHSLPYAIVDKRNATLFLFDSKGKQLDEVPVLIGIAVGDEASPGVGSKKLAEIGPAEKTTPAGRFLAKFGLAFKKERILWVDYATSVALHPIPADVGKKERRRERMLSPTSDDNRITFGCINVPKAFYGKLLRPQFQKQGGYVYVLPDTKPLEEVFPRLRVQTLSEGAALR